MATLPDLQDTVRRVRELIDSESAPGDFHQIRDLASEAAIQVITEGGFDAHDSDLVFGGDMEDCVQALLEAAFILQPQLATRILELPDYDADVDYDLAGTEVVVEEADQLRQTVCGYCGLDVEGTGTDWRDRGGNRLCPGEFGIGSQSHLPAGE